MSFRVSRETRYVLGASTSLLVGAALLIGMWFSPWSPAALDRPAVHLARGDAATALDAYVDLAQGWGPETTRDEALWRAAHIAAVDLGDADRAARLFRAYLRSFPDGAHRADALAQRAELHAAADKPLKAAASWSRAADTDPAHADAGAWLFEAGVAYLGANRRMLAASMLRRAAEHDDHAVRASLTLGRLYLGTDPAQAYSWYEQALQAGPGADEARLARLGQATALETMDQQEQALAELELGIDDEDTALRLRRERLEARQARETRPSPATTFGSRR